MNNCLFFIVIIIIPIIVGGIMATLINLEVLETVVKRHNITVNELKEMLKRW